MNEPREVTLIRTEGQDYQCQIDTTLSPSSTSRIVATGIMFSVTAKQSIEFLSFEFEHFPFDGDLQKEYLNYRNHPQQWTLVSETTGVESPDSKDENIMIVPRADMAASVPLLLNAEESRSFFFTLKSQHLQLDQPSSVTTGQEYLSDNMLQVNTGIGIRLANFPTSQDDWNRAFAGTIHYRSIANCTDFWTETQIMLLVVVETTNASPVSSSTAKVMFRKAFAQLLNNDVTLHRWRTSHGLQLTDLQ
jgi:hypothetical protein